MTFQPGNKFGRPAGKGNSLAAKHSLWRLRRMLNSKLDHRTTVYKVLCEKEQELITSLGGDPSPQERILIADAVKNILYIGTIDEYLLALDGGIIRNNKLLPVIEQRTALASHLRRTLEALGLQRVSRDIDLATKYRLGLIKESDNGSDKLCQTIQSTGRDEATATTEAATEDDRLETDQG
jgi:hypothetical protein